MTKRIIFTGKADFRRVAVEDLKLAGVEDEKELKALTFRRNTPTEVSDLIFEALVTDEPGLFGGGFKKAPKLKVPETAEEEEELEEEEKEAPAGGSTSTTKTVSTPSGNNSSTKN